MTSGCVSNRIMRNIDEQFQRKTMNIFFTSKEIYSFHKLFSIDWHISSINRFHAVFFLEFPKKNILLLAILYICINIMYEVPITDDVSILEWSTFIMVFTQQLLCINVHKIAANGNGTFFTVYKLHFNTLISLKLAYPWFRSTYLILYIDLIK